MWPIDRIISIACHDLEKPLTGIDKTHGWAVKKEGSQQFTIITETKKDVITVARQLAKNNNSELVIHGKDGRIQNRGSYGKDPNPLKEKKHEQRLQPN